MHPETALNAPPKYAWKPWRGAHWLGAAATFGLFWVLSSLLPGGAAGGTHVLPAMTVLLCRPDGRRDWAMAALAALTVAAVQLGGQLVGFAVMGTWPSRALAEGSDLHQAVLSFGMAPGVVAAMAAGQALGRRPAGPDDESERGYVDFAPVTTGILVATGVALFFGGLHAGRAWSGPEALNPGAFSLVAGIIAVTCGGVTLAAWPQAGTRRPLLLARLGLSVAIGIAGFLVFAAVRHRYGTGDGGLTNLAGLALIAVWVAAPTLAWWQLKRIARRHGMLRGGGRSARL